MPRVSGEFLRVAMQCGGFRARRLARLLAVDVRSVERWRRDGVPEPRYHDALRVMHEDIAARLAALDRLDVAWVPAGGGGRDRTSGA